MALIRFVGKLVIIRTLSYTKPIEFCLNNRTKYLSLNSTDHTMLYAQKDDRVVTTDCVTSLYPVFM